MSFASRIAAAVLALLLVGLIEPSSGIAGAYPGTNGKIAYISNGDIWTVNPDGTDPANVTNTPGLSANDISTSPDGKWIAFSVEDNVLSDEGAYVVSMDGSVAFDVLAGKHDRFIEVHSPTWSPDGTRIAFDAYKADFTSELFVIDLDGSDLTQLTNCDCTFESTPIWSPVGPEIAFVDENTLLTVNADNKQTREVYTNFGYQLNDPTWSPDGTQFAFDDLVDIYRVPATGGQKTNLTGNSTGFFIEPAWSPDGTKIAVQSNTATQDTTSNQDIYVLSATNGDAGGVTRVTTALGAEHGPDWSPLCEGRCTPTNLSLRIAKTRTALRATGLIEPHLPGQSLTVTLFRKAGAGWKQIAQAHPKFADDGTYRAAFKRPTARTCKVEAIYAGDAEHDASLATKTFKC